MEENIQQFMEITQCKGSEIASSYVHAAHFNLEVGFCYYFMILNLFWFFL